MSAIALAVILILSVPGPARADTAEQLVEVYKRSMLSWSVDYDTLRPNRAGAACIPWGALTDTFLDEGLFKALGYAWQVAGEPVAVRAALEGCERMRRGERLERTCTCELLLYNDEVRVVVPEEAE